MAWPPNSKSATALRELATAGGRNRSVS